MKQGETPKYNHTSVERKWQKRWIASKIFEADVDKKREKYFINFPFPYVNGAPHLGHGYSLMKAEIMSRYQRMLGKNVLFPFAFHATGEPIAGLAKRVAANDENQIRALRMSDIPEKEITNFTNAEYIINYFISRWKNATSQLGLSIDWRREFVTTQLTPVFSKFVEWQYRKLKKDGYVVQGSHPVIWCPRDQNPTGDHDRLEGEGVRVVDFVVIKFKSKKHDAYYLPATLRPETVFGVTNMFVHPDAKYVKIHVKDDWYIVAEENVIKFQDQQHVIDETVEIPTNELIGDMVINPLTNSEVIVLPGEFIDPAGSSGVVMSVPGHAPMDWIVLQELKANPESLSSWGITKSQIENIKPISLIKVPEYGEFPAGEEITSMKITSMKDPEVKQATRTIYRKEFNHGILKPVTGKYKGNKVSEIKEEIIKDFVGANISFILKEPADLVICRCGTRNHVKYLENQWFLEFGNEEWKKNVHEMLDTMNIYPKEARSLFHYTIDWLENKACARKSGLGTPLPWDNDWIVETLSDSVIYMAYYIISKFVNQGKFKIEYATDPIFNYILLGKGVPKQLSQKFGIDKVLLMEIRKELKYFYGFDLRSSGNDLIMNHLTFMLMHHRAIFPKEFWPKGIAVNGHVTIIKPGAKKAVKMSKSKGDFKTIEDVVEKFGVDATRLGFAIAGEGLKDAQFSLKEADSYKKWVENIYELSFEEADDDEILQIDKWLQSRIHRKIKKVRQNLSQMNTRTGFQAAYHEMNQDMKWYLRKRRSKGPAYREAIETMISMVCPFIPHVVEEIWEHWGNEGFAVNSPFPNTDESKINQTVENAEKYLNSFLDDLRGLRRFLSERNNPDPKLIQIFVAPEWMYSIYNEAYENGLDNLIKRIMQNPANRKLGKQVPKYCQSLMKAGGPPDYRWEIALELNTLKESKQFLEAEMGVPIEILNADGNNHPKAKAAVPRRPGINFEM